MSITASFNGNIQLTDSTSGAVAFKKVLASLSLTATDFLEAQGASFGTGPTSVTLPLSPILFFYFKNLHATQTITITWTPNGGASNPVITLQPGAAIMFTEVTALSGITALSIVASGASTTCEYVLAG